ncbi:ATP-dependent DNA helicase II subunit 2 [Chamberlinius hualienensis]
MARRRKEALVFLVDVGPSSNVKYDEAGTFLQQSINCIKQVLQRKIFSESNDELGLIVFGCKENDNPLYTNGQYSYISVKRKLAAVNWEFLQLVDQLRVDNEPFKADFIDAVMVGCDHIYQITKDWKTSERNLYIFSPFQDPYSIDQVETILSALVNSGIRFNVIGPNKEVNPQIAKQLKISTETRQLLNHFVEESKGLWFSFEDTLKSISQILPRIPSSMPWKANLKLGKLEIPVSAFLKVKKHQPKSWKKSYRLDKSCSLEAVKSFHRYDEAQTECDEDDIVARYKYGCSLVIYTPEDKANMEYKSGGKCLTILGFTKLQNIKRHHFLGEGVHYIVADKMNPQYANFGTEFSAFVNALYETEMVAIVRKVYSVRSAPIIGCLSPLIQNDYQCLQFVQLPFMEDLRLYTFQSLNMEENTQNELELVDELIDTLGPKHSETKSILTEEIGNPYIRRLFQCISQKIIHPEESLQLDSDELTLKTSKQIEAVCKPIAEKLKQQLHLEKVEHESKKRAGAAMFQMDDVNIEAKMAKIDDKLAEDDSTIMIGETKSKTIGSVNPVQDYIHIITKNPEELLNASKELEKVVIQLVTDSVGEMLRVEIYSKAVDCLQILRENLLKDHPIEFNDFLTQIKDIVLNKRKEQLWELICKKRIGLISTDESSASDVNKSTADEFFVVKNKENEFSQEVVEDIDDLLGEM